MRVVCRADASHFLGIGHIMRVLTLLDEIRRQGGDAKFVSRAHSGHLANMIEARGFACQLLALEQTGILGDDMIQDALITRQAAEDFGADWVLVDHYGTNAAWESAHSKPVLAIEDLTDRTHDCDILLNQNLGARAENYINLCSESTTCLMGPAYALLRPEFATLRSAALIRRAATKNTLRRGLISMGGSDQPNATGWVLKQLEQIALPPDFHLTIVMGPTAPHLQTIQKQAVTLPCSTTVLAGTSKMGDLMLDADFAIGAAGSTSWERCCLGLPAVMVVLADNQRSIAQELHLAGAACAVNMGQDEALKKALSSILFDSQSRADMTARTSGIVDGQGARRVVAAMYASMSGG